jgi:hypothetical protein
MCVRARSSPRTYAPTRASRVLPAYSTHASIAAARVGSVAEGYREAADVPVMATAFLRFLWRHARMVRVFLFEFLEREESGVKRARQTKSRESRARATLRRFFSE